MIRKPTVLILGAGASKPYGYPLGKRLVERILALSLPQGGALGPILAGGYNDEQLRQFRQSLSTSRPASIDDFLEANEGFRELGRVCITSALTVFGPQRDEPFAEDTHDRDWLEFLWWSLHSDAPTSKKFAENRLKVITYNYDTSFERYLASALSGFYHDLSGRRRPDADQFLSEVVPIVHIHGSLGLAIDELRGLEDPKERNLITWYKQAANGIRILSEGEHAIEYSRAKEWIREADVIYFLGFGYHDTNTRRLDLRAQLQETIPQHPDRIVKGTALGLGDAKCKAVAGQLNVNAETIRHGGGLLYPLDARTFLETHGLA